MLLISRVIKLIVTSYATNVATFLINTTKSIDFI